MLTGKSQKRLLNAVKQQYEVHLLAAFQEIDTRSQKYWTDNTEKLRSILVQIVSGADEVLTDERQQELRNIIITYQKIAFDVSHAESVFRQGEFEKKVAIGGIVFWQEDHLDLKKLSKTYNNAVKEDVQVQYESIHASHQQSAHLWIQSLLDEIRCNIVKYSPELSKQARQIQDITSEIEELVERQAKLKDYTIQLNAMMDWKRKTI